jgi:hypothetical protein
MWKPFALLGVGLAFAMAGIGHIGLSVTNHTKISDALEWLCLVGFATSVLLAVSLVIFEAVVAPRR